VLACEQPMTGCHSWRFSFLCLCLPLLATLFKMLASGE
jgi:hypothetical protein